MKTSFFLPLIIVLTICLSVTNGTAEELFAKLATTLPAEHPTSRALIFLHQEIAKSFAGQFHVQLFPDAQLGNTEHILQGMQFGSLELGVIPADLLLSYSPAFAAISMPYIFRDPPHRFRVLDGPVGMRILKSLARHKLMGLGFFDTGMRHIISRTTPLENPDAYQEKTIGVIRRCQEEDGCLPILPDLIRQSLLALGAIPEMLDMKDVAVSLRADMIAGVECSPEEILAMKLTDIDELYLNTGMFYSVPDVLVASKTWFDSLSPQMQDMLWNASRRAVNQQHAAWAAECDTMMKKLESQGITFNAEESERIRHTVKHLQSQAAEMYGDAFALALHSILSIK